jgi:hypothetical protein
MAESLNYIQMVQAAVEKSAGCKAEHNRTVPVTEHFQGRVTWDGKVEEFLLIGHPQAKHAYGWGQAAKATGQEVQVHTVIGLPPVHSPRSAVQAFILSEIKAGKL